MSEIADERLIAWAYIAYDTLNDGVRLMPLEQLSEWRGVGTTMNLFPLELNVNAPRPDLPEPIDKPPIEAIDGGRIG